MFGESIQQLGGTYDSLNPNQKQQIQNQGNSQKAPQQQSQRQLQQKPPVIQKNINAARSPQPKKQNTIQQNRQRSNTPQKQIKTTQSILQQNKRIEENKQQQQSSKFSIGVISYPKINIMTSQQIQIRSDVWLKQFEKNIKMNSFLDENKNILQKQIQSPYFSTLFTSKVTSNRNELICLNFSSDENIKQKINSDTLPGLFEDQEFPCSMAALSWIDDENSANNIKWKRPQEVITTYPITLFQNISPSTVIQGQFGDCFLISSISVLAEQPNLLKSLVKEEGQGKYSVWLCCDGRWRKVEVDDRFPTQNGKLLGAQPYQGDIGVLLIEKAYAKQYGRSYKRIEVGFSLDALKDLTGAPAEYIDLKTNKNSFDDIKKSLEDGFVLTVSSKVNGNSEGVVSKHCYGVLSVQQFQIPQQKDGFYKIIKLRNPYGNLNTVKKQFPKFVLEKLGETQTQSNGIFWVDYNDFLKDFEVVTVCKIHKNYINSYVKIKSHQMIYGGQASLQLLRVQKQTHLYLGIHQKHTRYFKKSMEDTESYKYKVSRIVIVKLQGENEYFIDKNLITHSFSCNQSTFTEAKLDQGTYLIYAEVDGNEILNSTLINNRKLNSYTISCYSDNPITLEPVKDFSFKNKIESLPFSLNVVFNILYEYLDNIKSKEDYSQFNGSTQMDKNSQQQVVRYYGTIMGYVFIYHVNKFIKSKYIETQEFLVLKNLTYITDGQSLKFDHNNWKVELPPQTRNLILFQIGNNDNCSHKIVFKSKPIFETLLT